MRSALFLAAALAASALQAVEFRTLDGSGNNQKNPRWGAAGTDLRRIAPNAYADGISSPTVGNPARPSARVISNAIVAHPAEEVNNARGLSAFIYNWGQLLDHDMDRTDPGTPGDGGVAFDVLVPTGDPFFDPSSTGTQVIPLSRSHFDPRTGTSRANPRQQTNSITAYIDATFVYGSSKAESDALREFTGGRLKVTPSPNGDLPPKDSSGNFLAGDVRANENIELTAIHTLFIREHNRVAKLIANATNFNDQTVFQLSRKIVGAEVQIVTYNEWLPALGVRLPKYTGYKKNINAGIFNEFSAACFRLGHSLLQDEVEVVGDDGEEIEEIQLKEAFFNPTRFESIGPDFILKGLASSQAEELDNLVVDGLRNFLFGQPGSGGFDLASLNIQRGRDHGLADYNTVRAAFGLRRVVAFSQITANTAKQAALEALYGNVNNIDLWVGALAEDHLPGSTLGPLLTVVVGAQFLALRDGDRFFFLNDGDLLLPAVRNTHALQSDLDPRKLVTLRDIILRNTALTQLQANVFFFQETD